MYRKSHLKTTGRRTGRILELWHIDLIGPMTPASRRGNRYIFTIVDDY